MISFDSAWREMLGAVSVSEEDAAQMKSEVLARYGEPERAYHNLGHALRVWENVKKYALQEDIEAAGAVQLAALLHDVIYDTKRQDNEERSAEFALDWGRRLGIAPATAERAAKIIRATQQHGPTELAEVALVLDADLTILAASWDEYDAYRQAIRREYAWVAEADWITGRGRVLSAFLGREWIYHLPAVRNSLETAARENIAREISLL